MNDYYEEYIKELENIKRIEEIYGSNLSPYLKYRKKIVAEWVQESQSSGVKERVEE